MITPGGMTGEAGESAATDDALMGAMIAEKQGRFLEAARLFERAAADERMKITEAAGTGGETVNGDLTMSPSDESDILVLESHGWYNRSLVFDETIHGLRLSIFCLENCILCRNRALALLANSGDRDESELRLLEGNLRFAEANMYTQRCNLEILRSDPLESHRGMAGDRLGRAAAFLLSAEQAKMASSELTVNTAERQNRRAGAAMSRASRASLLAEISSDIEDFATALMYLEQARDQYGNAADMFREALQYDDSVPKRENMETVERVLAGTEHWITEIRERLDTRSSDISAAVEMQEESAIPGTTAPPGTAGAVGTAVEPADIEERTDVLSVETYFTGYPVKNIYATLIFEIRNLTPVPVNIREISAEGAFSGKLSDAVGVVQPFSGRIVSLVLKPESAGVVPLGIMVSYEFEQDGGIVDRFLSEELEIFIWPDRPARQDEQRAVHMNIHGDYIGGNLIQDSVVYRSTVGRQ